MYFQIKQFDDLLNYVQYYYGCLFLIALIFYPEPLESHSNHVKLHAEQLLFVRMQHQKSKYIT